MKVERLTLADMIYSCYLIDAFMQENSLTAVSSFSGVAKKRQYYNYTYFDEINNKYYNIELNNFNCDKLSFDSSFYINITEIKL